MTRRSKVKYLRKKEARKSLYSVPTVLVQVTTTMTRIFQITKTQISNQRTRLRLKGCDIGLLRRNVFSIRRISQRLIGMSSLP